MQDCETENRINRRNVTNLTPEQVKELEKVFEETRFPDGKTISDLCVQLHLSKTRIQDWLRNRRKECWKHARPKKLVNGHKNRDMQDGGTKNPINRRIRTNLTPEQVKELEKRFEETRFPDGETISELSVQLHLSKNRINDWLRNRRKQCRKHARPKKLVNGPKNRDMQGVETENRIKQRNWTNITPEQVKELEKVFEETRFPDDKTMSELSLQLHLSKTRIQDWLRNRRKKWQKHTSPKELVNGPKNRDVLDGGTEDRNDRRNRTTFTPEQLKELEKVFEKTHFPDGQNISNLSVRLQLSEKRIKVWFRNRRKKSQKHGSSKKLVRGITENRTNTYCSKKLECAIKLILEAESTYRITANRRQLVEDVSNICLFYLLDSLHRVCLSTVSQELVKLITSMLCFHEETGITDEIFQNVIKIGILDDADDDNDKAYHVGDAFEVSLTDNESVLTFPGSHCHRDETTNVSKKGHEEETGITNVIFENMKQTDDDDDEVFHAGDALKVFSTDNESSLMFPGSHCQKDETTNGSRKASFCQIIAAEDVATMGENTCREAELLSRYVRKDVEIAENRGKYVYCERDITCDSGINSSCRRNDDKSISKGKISEVINKSPKKIVKANNVSKIPVETSDHVIMNADSSGDVIEKKKKQNGRIVYMHESSSKNEFIDIVRDMTGTFSESNLEQSVCQNIRKGIDENLNQRKKNLEKKNENDKDTELRVKKKKKNILLDIFGSSGEVELEPSIFDKTKKGTETDLQNMNVNSWEKIENISCVSSFMKRNESLIARYGKKKSTFLDILESSGGSKLEYFVSDQIKKKTEAKSRDINQEILCCSKSCRCSEESRLNGKKKKKNVYSFLIESSSESDLEQTASEKIKNGTDISFKKEEKILKRENNKPLQDSKCVTSSEGLRKSWKKKKRDLFSFIIESVSDSESEPSVIEKNQNRCLNKADSQFECGNEKSSFSKKCNKKTKKKRNFFRFLDDIGYETENYLP